MKKMITRLARFAAVAAVFGSLILAGPTPSSASEGNGVGSGGSQPPKVMIRTPDFIVYVDGLVVYADGSYGYAW